jgi:hypothetical protein
VPSNTHAPSMATRLPPPHQPREERQSARPRACARVRVRACMRVPPARSPWSRR